MAPWGAQAGLAGIRPYQSNPTIEGNGCSPSGEVGELRAPLSNQRFCMAFLALGINHKTASVDVRERVAFTPDQMVEALRQLCRVTPTREAAILSTCNRSELYLQQDQLEADAVLAWLANYHRLSLDELKACAYVHVDDEAVRHMMRVASGLDSMVLGEPQILGQMKSAFAVAREAGTLGPLLGRLFQATFSTAKTVRTDTAIGENPVSVAFAAVSLAKQIFADLHRSQALLIGAGETISLVARHLHDQGIKRIVVANRTLERASSLAEQFGAHAVLLSEIPDELVNSDIVISSTASQLPILGKGAVERALKQRKRELAAVDVLKAYRQQAERLRDEELNKALRLLNNGSSAEDVLALLARGLNNKLLHAPSVQLKKFSADGRVDALGVAQELFALDEGAPPASTHSSSANQ